MAPKLSKTSMDALRGDTGENNEYNNSAASGSSDTGYIMIEPSKNIFIKDETDGANWWEPNEVDKCGLSDDTVDQAVKRIKIQITKDESKTPCHGCGRSDLKKTDLLHLSPMYVQTYDNVHAMCFECCQCENESEPWTWLKYDVDDRTYDWRAEAQPTYIGKDTAADTPIPHSRPAFLPISSLSAPDNANKQLLVTGQIHEAKEDKSGIKIIRQPMFQAKDRETNLNNFRRAAKRSWVQWGIINKGCYEATGRNLDYKTLEQKVQAQIELENPGTKITKRLLKNAMLKDCSSFGEALARSILQGPKRERQIAALITFEENLRLRAEDVNYKIRAINTTFQGNRFAEYLDVVAQGHNQHFVCRSELCRSFYPSDCWLQAFNHNGSELVPNLWQYRCPMCWLQYSANTETTKRDANGNPWVPAQKIIAVNDMYQQAPIWNDVCGPPKPATETMTGDPPLTSTSAKKIRNWEFFVCVWEDRITGSLLEDLKSIWSDVETECNNLPATEIQKTILDLAEQWRHQAYFKEKDLPAEITKWTKEHNDKNPKIKWSDARLPSRPNGTKFVPTATYEYRRTVTEEEKEAGIMPTHIMSQKEQCRFWAYTSPWR